MMLEETYARMNSRVLPPAELTRKAIHAASSRRALAKAARGRALRRAIVLAAALGCLAFAVPALAAASPGGYRLTYALSPSIAQFFVPIQMSCEEQGIRMEVASAYIHGDAAEIYVSLQDLTGRRLDGAVDLYDSYAIHLPFDFSGTCSLADYDPGAGTVTFLISIRSMDGRSITGDKLTFSIGCLLTGKQEALNVPLTLDWSLAQADPQLRYDRDWDDDAQTPVLTPGEALCTLYPGFEVTGMGWVEGKLHIQLYIPGRHEYDDHAFLQLTDGEGNAIRSEPRYYGGYNSQTGERGDHIDYVFPVAPDQLSQYTLTGDFWSAAARIDGDWQVTFPLTASEAG